MQDRQGLEAAWEAARRRWREDGLVAVPPETAAEWRAAGWWRDRSLWQEFAAAAAQRGDNAAIVGQTVDAALPKVITYRQLSRIVDRCAAGLLELGVEPGEVVSLQLPNWWEFEAVALACARIGAVVNPIVPIYRHREVAFVLERTRTRVCIVPETFRRFDYAQMMAELSPDLPDLEHVFVLHPAGETLPGQRSFEEYFLARRWEDAIGQDELDARGPSGDDAALVMFTSGTTGEPKGVIHTHNTICIGGKATWEVTGLTAEDVVLMPSPVAHLTGYSQGFVMPLSGGAKVVLQDTWDPEVMLTLIEDEGVTWTMGAATFVVDAIGQQRARARNLESLRTFVTAGTAIPPHLVTETREVLGAELVAVWGMTEVGSATVTRPGDSIETVTSSDGQPVPWMEVRVVDDDGKELPVGESGRLLVRGAAKALGYFRRPDVYAAATVGDGWLDTGDLARSREDGGIRIVGRSKDIIIRGGENVPVVEVEGVLAEHPKVAHVALVGYPDERMGERGCAFIIAEGTPPSFEELTQHLDRAGMARQFWPERLEVVEEIPMTASGKIQKFQLREQLRRQG